MCSSPTGTSTLIPKVTPLSRDSGSSVLSAQNGPLGPPQSCCRTSPAAGAPPQSRGLLRQERALGRGACGGEWVHVCVWLSPFAVHLRPSQLC